MFTDINAAIAEARALRKRCHRDYGVFQSTDSVMVMPIFRGVLPMFTTQNDGRGTVNTDEQRAA